MWEKRVYGVLGISSIMANWNADFSGFPKTTSDGETYGSDKAFKYPMKKMWENQGEKVLYIKSYKLSTGKDGEVTLVPRTLGERYLHIYQEKDIKNADVILKNLFSAIDVKNFGATFAEAKNNISITGAVQFGQGFNKYEDTSPQEQPILSPFRDSKDIDKKDGNEAKNSTLGTKIVSDEAHYFYPFSVNPLAYKEYMELGVTEGYTEEDYLKFKKTALIAATSYATNAKAGCENEFGLFVETEPDLYLPNLSEYLQFEKDSIEENGRKYNKIIINCGKILEDSIERIHAIEIYYNEETTKIEYSGEHKVKYFNIFTQKEV